MLWIAEAEFLYSAIFLFQPLERLRLMIGFMQAFVVSLAGFYSCIFTLLTILCLDSEARFVVNKKIECHKICECCHTS